MRTFAPGKLVLTGAYAVLEGAPAIAIAVSRGAFADTARVAAVETPEVRAALHDDVAVPHVDASSMFVGARKLGLGASAAILVASLGALAAEEGSDLADPRVRDALFARAREAHAAAQRGGSGVDVAACVHGGAIEYVVGRAAHPVDFPPALSLHVFACSQSARTSDLLAGVSRLAAANRALHRDCMDELVSIATAAAAAARRIDAPAFVEGLRRTARGLARLGSAAGIEIVPAGFDTLEAIAASEEASFSVSGAGGGDVAVYLGPGRPSPRFVERAQALGLFSLDLSLDTKGVRIAPAPATFAVAPVSVSRST